MQITTRVWARIERHFRRPCELNERGQIVYRDANFPVGHIAVGENDGWLVDTTGDRDELVCDLTRDDV